MRSQQNAKELADGVGGTREHAAEVDDALAQPEADEHGVGASRTLSAKLDQQAVRRELGLAVTELSDLVKTIHIGVAA